MIRYIDNHMVINYSQHDPGCWMVIGQDSMTYGHWTWTCFDSNSKFKSYNPIYYFPVGGNYTMSGNIIYTSPGNNVIIKKVGP